MKVFQLHDEDELQEEDSLRMNNISDAANTHVNDGSSGPAGAQFKLEVDETNARGASVPYSDQKYMQNVSFSIFILNNIYDINKSKLSF